MVLLFMVLFSNAVCSDDDSMGRFCCDIVSSTTSGIVSKVLCTNSNSMRRSFGAAVGGTFMVLLAKLLILLAVVSEDHVTVLQTVLVVVQCWCYLSSGYQD